LQRGCLITFEGGEGAGKSTLIASVAERLTSEGVPFIRVREPGGTSLGEKIRALLLDASSVISSYAELCLFLASRAQLIEEVILPALARGDLVLCDRFNDSSIVYQGEARGLGVMEVAHFCNFISQKLEPDLTLYLDIEPSEGLQRVKGVRSEDRIEKETLTFHTRIRNAYLKRCHLESSRMHCLDGSQPPDVVFHKAIAIIHSKIKSCV
jgi:dTMP kinase